MWSYSLTSSLRTRGLGEDQLWLIKGDHLGVSPGLGRFGGVQSRLGMFLLRQLGLADIPRLPRGPLAGARVPPGSHEHPAFCRPGGCAGRRTGAVVKGCYLAHLRGQAHTVVRFWGVATGRSFSCWPIVLVIAQILAGVTSGKARRRTDELGADGLQVARGRDDSTNPYNNFVLDI